MGYDKPEQTKAIVLGTMYVSLKKDASKEDIEGCKRAVDYLDKLKVRFSCSIKDGMLSECLLTDKGYRQFTGMVSKYRGQKNQPDFCFIAKTEQSGSKFATKKTEAPKQKETNDNPWD